MKSPVRLRYRHVTLYQVMAFYSVVIFLVLLFASTNTSQQTQHKTWIANFPKDWHSIPQNGTLVSVTDDKIHTFTEFCDHFINTVDGFTDGEVVDAVEHFFWGQTFGLAMVTSATASISLTLPRNWGHWMAAQLQGV